MYQTLTLSFTLFSLLLFSGSQLLAAEDAHKHDVKDKPAKAEDVSHPYPLSVDPLGDSLVEVNKLIASVHEGRQLLFASAENLKKFKAEPAKYLAELEDKRKEEVEYR